MEEVYGRLRLFHGISQPTASSRLHALKSAASLPPDFDLEFDLTGNVYGPGRLRLGTLTEGGGP